MFWSPASSRILWIRGKIVLRLQIVEHLEIGLQLVVPLQCLQIANRGSRLNRRTESWRPCRNPFRHEEIRLAADANRQRSGKYYGSQEHSPRRTPHPTYPSCSRARHFFPQPRPQAGVEIRRPLRRPPFIQPPHRFLPGAPKGGTNLS